MLWCLNAIQGGKQQQQQLGSYHQGEDNSEGLYNQNMTVYTTSCITSKLISLLQTQLMVDHHHHG